MTVQAPRSDRLDLKETFANQTLVVIGGTGFVGKVWWVMMLTKFPDLKKIFLVVRAKGEQSVEQRFWEDIAHNECLGPLVDQHGAGFRSFLKEKIQVVEGDIVKPFCGISASVREQMRGSVDTVVNASGIVDFRPPLDVGLEVNAFGVRNLVGLARDIGGAPIFHTSTCYVAGYSAGIVEEVNPLVQPFPFLGKLERAHWDPEREISECLDIIKQAKQRAGDAFRQSDFLYRAKQNLQARNEPTRGPVLDEEIARVRRRFVEAQLSQLGQERAQFWGWPNTYTYTKSIGEQIAANSGLNFAIVRPAIVESCVSFPSVGWNEGINTSAPIIYAIREGQLQIPGTSIRLDVIPCDYVCSGMIVALAELLRGEHKPVYQFGSSDSNPITMSRIYELSGLYKRQHYQSTGRGGPIVSYFHSHVEGALLSKKAFERYGPGRLAKGASGVAGWLERVPDGGLSTALRPTVLGLRGFAKAQEKVRKVADVFTPFIAELDYEFRCDNTRAAFSRLSPEERDELYWWPERFDWRDWFQNVHILGFEKWVFPELDRRRARTRPPPRSHESLRSLLQQMAERHKLAIALQEVTDGGLSGISFEQWWARSQAAARRLQELGVGPGDRVVLCAPNGPRWAFAAFAIWLSGAALVPAPAGDAAAAARLKRLSKARFTICDAASATDALSLEELTRPGPANSTFAIPSDSLALISYSVGSKAAPHGVMLSHKNLCSLLASLAPVIPLSTNDRLLSVLPLDDPFELVCGLLMPLSCGSRVIYRSTTAHKSLAEALRVSRATGLVGSPPVWTQLAEEINQAVVAAGGVHRRSVELGTKMNRKLGQNFGTDLGRLLFGTAHRHIGGQLHWLINQGVAVDSGVQEFLSGLGLHLTYSAGATETGALFAVSPGRPRTAASDVLRALPGTELAIRDPDQDGVGPIVVRGPNVMLGYDGDAGRTQEVLAETGWCDTSYYGSKDRRGRVRLAGRGDELIRLRNSWHSLRSAEEKLEQLAGVREVALVRAGDGAGSEDLVCVLRLCNDGEAKLTQGGQELEPLLLGVWRTLLRYPFAGKVRAVVSCTGPMVRDASGAIDRRSIGAGWQHLPTLGDVPDGVARLFLERLAPVAGLHLPALRAGLRLREDLRLDAYAMQRLCLMLQGTEEALAESILACCQTIGQAQTAASLSQSVGASSAAADQPPLLSRLASAKLRSAPLPDFLRPAQEVGAAFLDAGEQRVLSRLVHCLLSGEDALGSAPGFLLGSNHDRLTAVCIERSLARSGRRVAILAVEAEPSMPRTLLASSLCEGVKVECAAGLTHAVSRARELLSDGQWVLLLDDPSRTTRDVGRGVAYVLSRCGGSLVPVVVEGTERLASSKLVTQVRTVRVQCGQRLDVGAVAGETDAPQLHCDLARRAERALAELSLVTAAE